ncbi:iron chelate uptake ABC transporter family permease subunit [Pseudomonas sp. LTJR-52]|uniref:iron chelate uptake ABC transporter family permease subunit n=1 Tax=Pseudomonas sp. LTJR-52 TaxID=2479392 RepID=UPI0021144B59|nr:iron chelate uptake ABC transporter family permease subunit [Pseudomonas sp. LTJR-52]
MLAYICASLLSGVMVAVSSAIGFVRLMLPYLARRFIVAKHRQPLPVVALLGGLFLLWIDMAAHTLFTSDDLPIGIATAVLGGGFFLILRQKR